MLQRQGKACFLSRNNQHIGNHCSQQGQYCFVCRGTFRQSHDCPKKQEENHIICLRCGDSGHDMFSCMSDYSSDDLKKIRCYACEDFGHLSCVKLPDTSPTEASCYNCSQSGHFRSVSPIFPIAYGLVCACVRNIFFVSYRGYSTRTARSVPKLFGARNPLLYATGAERKVILHDRALSLGSMLGKFVPK
ncbi:zinc finger protein GIS2-like [Hibiscus syriacus]|uniref:zinc finger protein GIS2-like n=1 Tax=Hibiscus syriacus TaxID=106335 RepID=UPI0019223B02|nr:zinc finger protein GIS2-like [Hibiscus syriacus]